MERVTIYRLRPITWKISVSGEDSAAYVREYLQGLRFVCSDPKPEPELHDPPLYSLLVTFTPETPLTADELEAVLMRDPRIELAFETPPAAATARH